MLAKSPNLCSDMRLCVHKIFVRNGLCTKWSLYEMVFAQNDCQSSNFWTCHFAAMLVLHQTTLASDWVKVYSGCTPNRCMGALIYKSVDSVHFFGKSSTPTNQSSSQILIY